MKSTVTKSFIGRFKKLPTHIKHLARKAYHQFEQDPYNQSLQFKCISKKKRVYSVRVGIHYRVLGEMTEDGIEWFWIGTHEEYNNILKK